MGDRNWVRSSFCAADKPQCVEVLSSGDMFHVRDSKHGEDGVQLRFTREEWTAFLAAVKAGEFDVAGDVGDVEIETVTTVVPEPA